MSEYTIELKAHDKIIIEEFEKAQDKTLTAYNEALQKRLNLGPKQIIRDLEELESKVASIVELPSKGRKRKTFKMISPVDLFVETFEETEDIDWFFHMIHSADPKIFKALENYTNQNPAVYKFINTLSEDIENLKKNNVFRNLKTAVSQNEYRKIKYYGNDKEFDNLRCLRLLYIDNNWYLSTVADDNKLRLNRISFIEKVDYATNMSSFQLSKLKKQIDFLENKMQNSLTLYDEPVETATLRIDSEKARYFGENMKKFMSTQKYQETLPDGSIIFTLEYTQPLEILPFIQGWLPHLTILEPQELKDAYIENLNNVLSELNS